MKSTHHPTTAASSWRRTLFIAATAVTLSSAYTFDPLNNIWKPSGRPSTSSSSSSSNGHQHHHATHHNQYHQHYQQQYHTYYNGGGGSAASYAEAHPGLDDPYESDGINGDVQVFEGDVIRAQYSTWIGRYHNGENKDDGEDFRPKSLVQIEYNKKTGEISLVDQDGIITAEDYQRLMKIVMMQDGEAGGAATSGAAGDHNHDETSGLEYAAAAGDAIGSTLYVDAEDLDHTKVIDTDAEVLSCETIPLTPEQQQQLEQQHMCEQSLYEAQEAAAAAAAAYDDQTYSNQASYSHHNPSTVEMPAPRPPTETFNSYNIPQSTSVSATYQPYQRHAVATATAATHVEATDSSPRGVGFGFNQRRKAFM